MKRHVLILGAGFRGLELATRLSESLADEVHVTLVDQNDAFVFGFSKLEILFGPADPRRGELPVSGHLQTRGQIPLGTNHVDVLRLWRRAAG